MNLAERLLHALRDHGASRIFGIPGDFALPLFRVIERSGILPLHTLSHEPAVGFAADAAARYAGGLGVAAVTYGAGAFNLVNPVACAYAEKSPLVVISGAPGVAESRSDLLLHHQARRPDSQFEVFREITCDQALLDDPHTAPAAIARVLRSCLDQSRPVYLELPRDRVGVAAGPVPRLAPAPADPEALAACAGDILAELAAATRPLLLVGVEVRRFGLEAKVARLARTLGLPVATTFMGRGLLAGEAAPLLGTYLGEAGDPAVSAAVEDSDCPLLLGAIISDTNFGVSARRVDMRRAILAADGRVRIGHRHYPEAPLGTLVDALLEQARPTARALPPPPAPGPRGLLADGAPVTPADVARAVNDLFDRHGPLPVAADMGDCLFTAMEFDHTHLVAPGYYATMGFGIPAGLGLQAASGLRPLVLAGDGAFQMTGWELGNARRYGWDPIVLVFNNRGWGMLETFQPESGYNRLDDWRFSELAGPLGGDGVRVDSRRELAAALERAAATRGRFQLIEILLEPGRISPTLQRFVDAQNRRTGMSRG